MKAKFIFLILVIFFSLIIIIYISNKRSPTEISQFEDKKTDENAPYNKNNEMIKNTNSELETTKSEMKKDESNNHKNVKYSEKQFLDLVKINLNTITPNSKTIFFVDNISAIHIKANTDSLKEILWSDDNFVYFHSNQSIHNFSSKNSYVVFDKKTSEFGITNGFYIIKYLNEIGDIKLFENTYQVNKISLFPKERILIVRANESKDLIEIQKNLKTNPNFKSVILEITNDFLKTE